MMNNLPKKTNEGDNNKTNQGTTTKTENETKEETKQGVNIETYSKTKEETDKVISEETSNKTNENAKTKPEDHLRTQKVQELLKEAGKLFYFRKKIEAIELYDQAISLDNNCARAYSAKA
ncbi:MAG: hypothetical protein SFT93_02680, partial [Rickettsiaceae bacterium]|nr:hypothetical protein [Rickettsiaceae bacterium]